MQFLWTFLSLFLLLPGLAWGQYSDGATLTTVEIVSSSVGKQVVSSIPGVVTVELAVGASGAVWIARINGDCATVMTDDAGIRLSRDVADKDPVGWQFKETDGWVGQLCAILESGATQVDLKVNKVHY